MSNSPLVSYAKISPFRSSPRNHTIDSVAIHIMAGNLTIESCGELFQTRKGSSNYGIGSDGRIAMYVEEGDRSWCTSSAGVDNRSVTIEVANTEAKYPWPVSEKAYQSLITLLVDICRRNGIPGLLWKDDKTYGIAASRGGPVSKQNMFAHRWFEAKECPGDYLYEKFGAIANEVNVIIASGGNGYDVPQTGSASIVTGTEPLFPIDLTQIKPYLVVADRGSVLTKENLANMQSGGAIGALIEAGYYFDTTGQQVKSFRSPKVVAQSDLLEELNMPYGYYMLGRARNTVQADQEIAELAFHIRTSSPTLGVWIRTEFPSTNKDLNDLIIDKYHKELVRLGLIRKVGLISNQSLMKRFNWSKHKDDWLMLYEDHVDSTAELGELFTPEFFDLAGKYT